LLNCGHILLIRAIMSKSKDQDPEVSESGAEARIDPPPILKTWKALYTLVLVQLGLTIVAFYFFTKLFE
jgi:hypothetical protein